MSQAILPTAPVLRVLEKPVYSKGHWGTPPRPGTPLFGREIALAEVREVLAHQQTRLLTLIGAGGTGKSRLALELAYKIGADYTNVWFVDLATVREAQLVPSAIAQAIGVQEGGSKPLRAIFQEMLAGQPSLILLDNFEHVMDAAPFVADFLSVCPELVVVVTSREMLSLRAERVYLVEPLPVPDLTQLDDMELTRRVPSVVLFGERATARRATFQLTDEALPAVAEICVRLDGLPLAIELAAAQAAVLAPAAILKRLEARTPLLGTAQRDLPARHQTLQATVAWSYDLLTPAEQVVFRACGVFSGGFTAQAVEWVHNGLAGAGEDALAILAQLVSKSLVRIAEDAVDQPRFWLLATIRDYAIDQLARSDELVEARSRHAAYYVEQAETLQQSLRGRRIAATLNELSQMYGNFRTVFQWASEVGDLATGLRLAGALNRFWMARGPQTEARSWLESALPRSAAISPSIRAAALSTAGVLAAIKHDHEQAIAYFQESLDLWEMLGDSGRQAGSHLNLGLVAYITGQVDEAERQFERGHDLYLAVGDRSGQARAVGHRARLAQEQHDLVRAKRLLEESFELSQAADDDWGVAHSLANLGQLCLALDDRPGAMAAFRQALEVWQKLGNFVDIAECFEGMAAATAGGQPGRAANLLGAAEVLRERSGAPPAAVELRRYTELVSRLHKQLREDTFASAWHQGRVLVMDRAIELAMRDDAPRAAHTDAAGVLSPREHEIAEMIARGLSNQGIADNLVVSIKTVESHIQHIFRKLSVKRRAEIATWIVRHGTFDNPT